MSDWTEALRCYVNPQLPEAVGRLRVGRLATQALSHNLINRPVYESVLSQKTYATSVEKLRSEVQGIIKEHNPLLRVLELDPVVPSTDASPEPDPMVPHAGNESGKAIPISSQERTQQRTGRITVLDMCTSSKMNIQQLFRAGGVTAMLPDSYEGRSPQGQTKANVADFSLVVASAMPIATTFLVTNSILPHRQTSTLVEKFIMNAVKLTCKYEVLPLVDQWHSWWLLHLRVAWPDVIQLLNHLRKQLGSDLSANSKAFAGTGSEDQFKRVRCVIGNSPMFFLEQISGMYLQGTKRIQYDSVNQYHCYIGDSTVAATKQRESSDSDKDEQNDEKGKNCIQTEVHV